MFTGLHELHWLCDCTTAAFLGFVPIEEIQIAFVSYSHLLPLCRGIIISGIT